MIILIRSNDASPDPRLQKYIEYLQKNNQKYIVLAWNRDREVYTKKNYDFFNKSAPYGLGVKNIPNKLLWFYFIIKKLIVHRKKYHFIHACDLDTALPAYIVNKFLKKRLIFDVFDWMSSEENKSLLGKIISKVENNIFKNADYTIICEKYRIEQVAAPYRRESMVLPNIPSIKLVEDQNVAQSISQQRQTYSYVISYVGVFDNNRGIEDILKVVSKNKDICLNIAGFGALEATVKKYSEKYSNVRYWGKVDYNTGLNIMKNSDLIIAFYYISNSLHKYAAPNKFYEGLFLGKPLLTNDHTLLSEKIKAGNTGFVINEGYEHINKFFEQGLDAKEVLEKSNNSIELWVNSYIDYTDDFMKSQYQEVLMTK